MSSLVMADVQAAFTLVAEPLIQVRESLSDIVPPDSLTLVETVRQSLSSGGKYLRPVITLLSGIATANDHTDTTHALIETAAVAEMIHVATLLHDDVLDKADLRRGRRTVRAQWGNKISVLSGDYLLAQASLKLSKLGDTRLVSIFAHVLANLCDGEVEQMQTSYTLNTSWDSYFRKTLGKTASLFSAGCESAGVVNALPEVNIQALKAYGRSYGIAFQVMDDLLDYTATEAELGKPVLDDLRNGLMNAPVLLALESDRLSETQRNHLRIALESLFEAAADTTQAAAPASASARSEMQLAEIRELMTQADAVAETRRLAEKYVAEACQSLNFVPDSPHKHALIDLARYITVRKN